ncbi:DUF2993 domain-containing protein [Microbacterium sp. STN6]|uniref:LmeA family phospholipid-binding protein n=1 Tax=Microbacterium sp. STN6 TaxID=2995588 RepID=UPI002260C542|nr:DUF2993 domain-containing protein [Microbacterium sp. STN6]MCX7521154.1 DUF2993 domain-containing protein [Microbacterium sp. STN6]
MTDIGSLEDLFAEPGEQRPRRRRRAWLIGLGVTLGLLVLIGIAAVLVDNGLRGAAEAAAATQIEKRLPAGVTGDVDVHIGGGSFILQYLGGSFDDVRVDAPDLRIGGDRVPVHLVAHGVSSDLSAPVKHVTARVALGQDALNHLVQVPIATGGITLGHGTFALSGSKSVAGLTLSFSLSAIPKADGDHLLLAPTAAKVTTGPAGLDFSSVIRDLMASGPIPVCLATQLPKGVELSHIQVTPEAATLTFTAHDLPLTGSALSSRGTCS